MKYTFIYLFAALTLLWGCDRKPVEPATPTEANVKIHISHKVGQDSLVLGEMKYKNSEGSEYQVDILKYYISNIVLVKDDGTEWKATNYELIDGGIDSSANILLSKVPNGTYTKMRFFVGIDSTRNHTGVQEGDLNPIYGMIWTWNTGYIFFKHDGYFKDEMGNVTSLSYHYGTDRALTKLEVPISASKLEVKGVDKKMNMTFDLNNLYSTPDPISFISNYNHQSISAADDHWIANMKGNFATVFSITKVE